MLGINIIAQLCFGFPIHEVIAFERGKSPLKEKHTNDDFECLSAPPSEAEEVCTLGDTFP